MPEINEEMDVLRRTNAELVEKSKTRKARITELETSVADLTAKLTASNGALHQIRVGEPLHRMAEEIGMVPELFEREFATHFRLEFADGKLSLLSTDGKAVVDKNGVAVPFERKALTTLLTEGDDARAKIFRLLIVGSKASGAGGSLQSQQQQMQRKPAEPKKHIFGLK